MTKIEKDINLPKNEEKNFSSLNSVQKDLIPFLLAESLIKKEHNLEKIDNYVQSKDSSCTRRLSGAHRSKKSGYEISETEKFELPDCNKSFIPFSCPNCGAIYYKALLCGRDWCPDCGQKNSWIHKRRIARLLDKFLQIDIMGYLVVTLPEELREHILSFTVKQCQIELYKIRKYWYRKLKRELNSRGFMTYHWQGETDKWFPHLDILIDMSHLDSGYIEKVRHTWKKEYLSWIEENYPIKVQADTTDLKYRYSDKSNEKWQWLKYHTKPTLRNPSEFTKAVFYKFKNFQTFGVFDKPVDGKDKLVALENCYCPDCYYKLEPLTPISREEFMAFNDKKHIQGGWFKWITYDDWVGIPEVKHFSDYSSDKIESKIDCLQLEIPF